MRTVLEILSQVRPEFDFSKGQNFIEEGMLDSFDLITLVFSLENNFNIRIDGIDIIPENFCSLTAIEKLVAKSAKQP